MKSFLILLGTLALWQASLLADDLNALQEQSMQAAVQRVAPSIVQIETSGGTDLVGSGPGGPQIRKGVGPTTGLVVSADGYVISSAFNFANKPTAIFVTIPSHKQRHVATVVATDHTRMLTLLKVDSAGLPVPAAAPKKDIKVGQSALALGRVWGSHDSPPSVSVGIVSALNRIWGKAIQTDAKVSPINYGGPLIDIQGRVLGVLVPASPSGQDDTAGIEWYDSGIGFAIPLEDINSVLPRLKEGHDLMRGLLGVSLQSSDIYGNPPIVATVFPGSAAANGGIKAGDTITAVDGNKLVRQAQMMHLLGSRYEGETVSVTVRRGNKEIDLPNLKLSGGLTAFPHPFLGILPLRDDPEPGVEVRYVFPKSPAEVAGVEAGDRILTIGVEKITPKSFSGSEQLMAVLNSVLPGTAIRFEVRHKGLKDVVMMTATLAAMADTIPEKLPLEASLKKALEPRKSTDAKPPSAKKKAEGSEKKLETGLLKRANASGDHEYWLYIPGNYNPNISHALIIWLHPVNKGKQKDIEALVEAWQDYCEDRHMLLLAPKAQNEAGWLASEADFVREAIMEIESQYTIDKQRVVAHGMGLGGQMAFYLGFHARDLIHGVATTGALLTSQPTDNVAAQRMAFFIVAGGKDPLVKGIADMKSKLVAKKYTVVYREIAEMGKQYLDPPTLDELVRWIDSLDRL